MDLGVVDDEAMDSHLCSFPRQHPSQAMSLEALTPIAVLYNAYTPDYKGSRNASVLRSQPQLRRCGLNE